MLPFESVKHMWDWLSTVGEWMKPVGSFAFAGLAWLILSLSSAAGLAGVVVPVIPGAIVLFLGALIHKWMLPEYLDWWTIGGLGLLVIVDRVVDFLGTALGAKWFGGTKWGIIGALVGGFVGLFLGIIGIIIGPVIGAIVFEIIWAKSHPKEAARAGVGAGVGFGISTLGRLIVCIIMLSIIFMDLVFY